MTRKWRLLTLLTTATALTVATVAPASAGTMITTVPSPTWGVYKACSSTDTANCASVYSITDIGGRVVLGGNFTDLVGPDGAKVPMPNLAELNESDGTPVPGFVAPALGGPVYTVASDGVNLYAGGHFPGNYAKVDPTTGILLWRGTSNATAYTLLPSGGLLYVGGFMGVWRVDAVSGVRDITFAPRFTVAASGGGVNAPFTTVGYGTYYVHGLAIGALGNRLYVSGHFDTVNGISQRTIAAVDPATGTHTDMGFRPTTDQASTDPKYQDGIQVIAAADYSVLLCQAGHTQAIYKFSSTGSRLWSYHPTGDCQTAALSPDGTTVYIGGHMHKRSTNTDPSDHAMSFDYKTGQVQSWGSSGTPGFPPDYSPYYWGVWTMHFVNGSLWVGGLFTSVKSSGNSYFAAKVAVFR